MEERRTFRGGTRRSVVVVVTRSRKQHGATTSGVLGEAHIGGVIITTRHKEKDE